MSETLLNIDKDIALQEWIIKRGEALERLIQNEDFIQVIVEGYLEVEAKRVFELLTSPLTVVPEDVKAYQSQLDTIKNLGRYLGVKGFPGLVKAAADHAKITKEHLLNMKHEEMKKGEKL